MSKYQDSDAFDEETLLDYDAAPKSHGIKTSGFWPLLLFSNLLTAVVVLLVVTSSDTTISDSPTNDPRSKFLQSIDRSMHTEQFNPFESPNAFTKAAKEAGDETTERWADLGVYIRNMLVPVEYAADFDLDPDRHLMVLAKDDPDAPYDGYIAGLEFVHQLHCLHLIHQGLYFNHEYYRSVDSISWDESQTNVVETHLSHCVDALRQLIMCEADIRVKPYLKSNDGDVADFARHKQCRNFESARRFAVQHQWLNWTKAVDKHHPQYLTPEMPDWTMDRLWSGH
ncbi:hypothetical protein HII31_05848 [Pseudocercospora fuligena]|uniref:Cyclochlorotine biosynthesis protein O n=1 Tax=Pseudocercospora fuligena TaxID=685502 RepID=A0A8H6VN47_9PEZI|nr:hypothetical protein HII31_05848 [Pseudocercospora fuligena]